MKLSVTLSLYCSKKDNSPQEDSQGRVTLGKSVHHDPLSVAFVVIFNRFNSDVGNSIHNFFFNRC